MDSKPLHGHILHCLLEVRHHVSERDSQINGPPHDRRWSVFTCGFTVSLTLTTYTIEVLRMELKHISALLEGDY